MLAYKDGQRVRLVSRKGRDRTSRFADLAAAISRLSARTLALDGEVAIYDPQLRSRFDWLRERPRRLGADRRQRLRGLVAKDEASAYEGGATRHWLMVKEDWTVAEDGWRQILEEDRR